MNWRLLVFLLLAADLALWGFILFKSNTGSQQDLIIYFLDVGQGDSELIMLDGIKILIDGGPNAKVLESLSKALPFADRSLDLVILTHPHLDHFGGLIDVIKSYETRLFLDSGFGHDTGQYKYFQKQLLERNIKHLALREGDRIRYKDMILEVLSPPANSQPVKAKDLHNNTIILFLKKGSFKGLFTGDTNFKVENQLLDRYKNLQASILKVSHHGSNNSTSAKFLDSVNPILAIIEVGKNSYGHPKPALLERLAAVGAKIFRTDINGTIKMIIAGDRLNVASER